MQQRLGGHFMKKIAVLLANGFEEIEALGTIDILRRAKFECVAVSIDGDTACSSRQLVVKADQYLNDEIKNFDMLVLPGGMPGAKHLKENDKVIELVRYFHQHNKYIAAICAAPIVLHEAGIIKDKKVTSYPDPEYINLFEPANYLTEAVVVNQNIVTSRGPATTFEFAYTLVDLLGGNSKELKEAMLYNQ